MALSKATTTGSSAEKQLMNLDEALRQMPRDMLVFSTIMRSLYVHKAVGTSGVAAVKFRKLRDDTRNDAVFYLEHILPMCKVLVSSIQSFFEYYSHLTYEEWKENLLDIVVEVRGYRLLCISVVKMHESMITPLKEREDQAKLVMKELKELQEEYEEKKRKYEDEADSKKSWFKICAFIPVVNVIACPLLKSFAESDTAKAVAYGAQANTQEAAACAVANALLPALQHFIDGLQCAAGFFEVMESELGQFAKKGKRAAEQDCPAQIHYKIMSKKADEMISNCRGFMFALPSVRTDFEAIPRQGTDQNYIDRWLVKQLKIIEETCTLRSIYNSIVKVVTQDAVSSRKRKVAREASTEILTKRQRITN